MFESILESLGRKFLNGIGRSIEENVEYMIRDNVQKATRYVLRQVISASVMLLSLLFFLFAIVFFLIEYLDATRTIAFFVVSIILLLVGIVLKLNN